MNLSHIRKQMPNRSRCKAYDLMLWYVDTDPQIDSKDGDSSVECTRSSRRSRALLLAVPR